MNINGKMWSINSKMHELIETNVSNEFGKSLMDYVGIDSKVPITVRSNFREVHDLRNNTMVCVCKKVFQYVFK